MVRIIFLWFLMSCGPPLVAAHSASAGGSSVAPSEKKSSYEAVADIVSQDEDKADISNRYLVVPLIPKGWMVVPPGLVAPPVVGAMVHEESDGLVHFLISPVDGKDGAVTNVIAMYLVMQEADMEVEPVTMAEDMSWAMFVFTRQDGKLRGKVFGKAFVDTPGYMVTGFGQWAPEKHKVYAGHLDRMVASAYLAYTEE